MKTILTAAAALATILTAAPATADRFVPVAMNEAQGSLLAINLDTIRDVDGDKHAWLMTVIAKTEKGPVYSLELERFDCKEQRARSLTSKFYNPKQEELFANPAQDWTYPVPGTGLHTALLYACGKKASDEEIGNYTVLQFFERFVALMRTKGVVK